MANVKLFGVLKTWNAVRGFGFIRILDAQGIETKYFLHVSKIISGQPAIGAGVYFLVGERPPALGISHCDPAIQAEIGEVIPKFRSAANPVDALANQIPEVE